MTELAHLLDVIEIMPDAVLVVDSTQHILACNPDVEPLFGYDAGELTGQHVNVLIPGHYHKAHAEHMAHFGVTGGSRLMDGRPVLSGVTKSGSTVPISIAISSVNASGERFFLAVVRDARSVEDTLELAVTTAEIDPLTGLGNRRTLAKSLTPDQYGAARSMALLYLDLDQFKPLNDRYGHEAGDRVLQIVAKRLRGAVRDSDVCIRLGGDEFVVILRGVADRDTLARIATKVHAGITAPFHFDEIDATVGVSMGGVISASGDDAATLLERADAAMFRAKRNGVPYCLNSAAERASAA